MSSDALISYINFQKPPFNNPRSATVQGDLFVTELCTSAFLWVISLQVDLFVAELTKG